MFQVLKETRVMLQWPIQDHQAPRVIKEEMVFQANLDRGETEAILEGEVFRACLVLLDSKERKVRLWQ